MTDVAARLSAVSFGYSPERTIVQSLTLDIRRGTVLALLGPNGSGKTTLLKLIAGALAPTAGNVESTAQIGFVPQLAQVSFAYSAMDVVLMGRARHIAIFATPSMHDESVAANALERVGMLSLAHRPFDTLSGGERQLVMFARALASEAELFVMDEPAASLDLAHQGLILGKIRELSRSHGMTVVFSTHQPQHAAAVADDAALMMRDGVVTYGKASVVMTAERLTELFGVKVRRIVLDDGEVVFVPAWAHGTPS